MISRLLFGISTPSDDLPGIRWMRTDSASRASERSSERLATWLTLIPGAGIELVGRDDRPGVILPDLAFDAELLELLLDPALLVVELFLVDLLRRLPRVEEVERREVVLALSAEVGEEELFGRRGSHGPGRRGGLPGGFPGLLLHPLFLFFPLPLRLLIGFRVRLPPGLALRGGRSRLGVLLQDLLPHLVPLLVLLVADDPDPDLLDGRFERPFEEMERFPERPAGGEEEEEAERGQEEDERADRAQVPFEEIQDPISDDAACLDDRASEGDPQEEERGQRTDDQKEQEDEAQAAQKAAGRALEDGLDRHVAEDEGEEEGHEAQEPEEGVGEVCPDVAGEVADVMALRRGVGERRVLGIIADEAEQGEESEEQEDEAGDLNRPALPADRGLPVRAALLRIFHAAIIA